MAGMNRQDGTRVWYDLSRMPQPVETMGTCKNFRYRKRVNDTHCGSHWAVLGNGYCVECWDKGKGGSSFVNY